MILLNDPLLFSVEIGDNIGGGSPGDSTFILEELLRQRASGFVVVLYDPESVQSCVQAGIGGEVSLRVGGKADNRHGDPVSIQGKVHLIHDGRFEETEPRHGGQRYHNQGLTAVVTVRDSLVVLTSRRQAPFSLQQLLSLGIEPKSMRMIVVKAAIAYRAAYEPIAGGDYRGRHTRIDSGESHRISHTITSADRYSRWIKDASAHK